MESGYSIKEVSSGGSTVDVFIETAEHHFLSVGRADSADAIADLREKARTLINGLRATEDPNAGPRTPKHATTEPGRPLLRQALNICWSTGGLDELAPEDRLLKRLVFAGARDARYDNNTSNRTDAYQRAVAAGTAAGRDLSADYGSPEFRQKVLARCAARSSGAGQLWYGTCTINTATGQAVIIPAGEVSQSIACSSVVVGFVTDNRGIPLWADIVDYADSGQLLDNLRAELPVLGGGAESVVFADTRNMNAGESGNFFTSGLNYVISRPVTGKPSTRRMRKHYSRHPQESRCGIWSEPVYDGDSGRSMTRWWFFCPQRRDEVLAEIDSALANEETVNANYEHWVYWWMGYNFTRTPPTPVKKLKAAKKHAGYLMLLSNTPPDDPLDLLHGFSATSSIDELLYFTANILRQRLRPDSSSGARRAAVNLALLTASLGHDMADRANLSLTRALGLLSTVKTFAVIAGDTSIPAQTSPDRELDGAWRAITGEQLHLPLPLGMDG